MHIAACLTLVVTAIAKAGLKKLFVCRHPTKPTLEVPSQNILLDL